MLYGREENNRVYLTWGTGRGAGLGRESCMHGFLENPEFTATLQGWTLNCLCSPWLEEIRVLVKPKLFSQDSAKSLLASFTVSLLQVPASGRGWAQPRSSPWFTSQ